MAFQQQQNNLLVPTRPWAFSAEEIIPLLESLQSQAKKAATVQLVDTEGTWKTTGALPQIIQDMNTRPDAYVHTLQVTGLYGTSTLTWSNQGLFSIAGTHAKHILRALKQKGLVSRSPKMDEKELQDTYNRIQSRLTKVFERIEDEIEPSIKQQEQIIQKHSDLSVQVKEVPTRLNTLQKRARAILTSAEQLETKLLEKESSAGSVYRDIEGMKAQIIPYREKMSKLADELDREIEAAKKQVREYSEEHKKTIGRLEEIALKVTSEQLQESFDKARGQVGFGWLTFAIVMVNFLAFAWIAFITIDFDPSKEVFSALALRAVAVVIVLPVDIYLLRELSAARREAQTYRFKQAVLSSLPEYRKMLEKSEDKEVKDFSLKVMERVYSNPSSKGAEDQLTPILEKILEPNGPLNLKPAADKTMKKAKN